MEKSDLLKRLRMKDHQALEAIIQQYCAYVSTVIRNQLGPDCSEQDVEELASEVFFALWLKCSSIRTAHLRGWLGTVARNQARSFQRKQKNRPAVVGFEDVITVSDDQSMPLLEQRELARILSLALQELGETDSRIFSMYYYEEQSVSSIAAKLRLHPEAVKSKLRRGREKLKLILLKEGYTV